MCGEVWSDGVCGGRGGNIHQMTVGDYRQMTDKDELSITSLRSQPLFVHPPSAAVPVAATNDDALRSTSDRNHFNPSDNNINTTTKVPTAADDDSQLVYADLALDAQPKTQQQLKDAADDGEENVKFVEIEKA